MWQHGDSRDAMLGAAEIKLRAERRLGELLAETIVQGSCNTMLPEGIGRMDSSRWQRIAGIDEERFETKIAEGREAGELTTIFFLGWSLIHARKT